MQTTASMHSKQQHASAALAPSVSRLRSLSANTFTRSFVQANKPVLLEGALHVPAVRHWDFNWLRQDCGNLVVAVKDFSAGTYDGIITTPMALSAYCDYIAKQEAQAAAGSINHQQDPPLYCHDVPLLHVRPDLRAALEPFPAEYFPAFYRKNWPRYTQFFIGPVGAFTPLHFDCLLTNNLFFQVHGRKRFYLIDYAYANRCGRHGWRWFNADPEQPDYRAFPEFEGVPVSVVDVGPGDVLFMPSGTLHAVRSLSSSISFNIDWHTPETALRGLLAAKVGMPRQNLRYNFAAFLGVACKVPEALVFPLYRSYLNYVS